MIDFNNVPTATLVAAHNACAELLGSKPVNKFADRPTAEKRTRFLLSQVEPDKRPAPFNYEVTRARPLWRRSPSPRNGKGPSASS